MKNNISLLRAIVINILLVIVVVFISFLLNYFIPLNFSGYFVLCTISLLLCIKLLYGKKNQRLTRKAFILPWALTLIASVLITINYQRPKDARVYSNVDAQVLALKGVCVKDSLILVSDEKSNALFDKSIYEGRMIVKPSDSTHCLLTFDVTAVPIYVNKDSLLNAQHLPSFNTDLEISNGSISCHIAIKEAPNKVFLKENIDTITVKIKFNDSNIEYTPFLTNKTIKKGYNLYDLIHGRIAFNEAEEELVRNLRDIYLLRNLPSKKFYITYNKKLSNLTVKCDGVEYISVHNIEERKLSNEDYLSIGIGTTETRPMSFDIRETDIYAHFQFPYLGNFPRSSIQEDYYDGIRKSLAISSSSKELLMSDVKEAFFFNLFENEDNQFHFDGFINYKVSDSKTPFKYTIIDHADRHERQENTLLAPNGAKWELAVYDLRKQSPIPGKENFYVNDFFILGIIFIMALFAIMTTQLLLANPRKAGFVMGVWLFIIPIFVLRLYLLWRIAVFPPVNDILLEAFLRYRMENGSGENAMLNTLISIGILMAFSLCSALELQFFKKIYYVLKTIFRYITKRLSIIKRVFCKYIIYLLWPLFICKSRKDLICFVKSRKNLVCFVKALFYPSIYLQAIILLWLFDIILLLLSSSPITNIVLPVLTFFAVEFIACRKLNNTVCIINGLIILGMLCKGDPGYAVMFFIFLCAYLIIHLYAYQKSNADLFTRKSTLLKASWLCVFLLLAIIILFSADIVTFAYDRTSYVLTPHLTYNVIFFTILGILLSIAIGVLVWHKTKHKLKWALTAICISLICLPAMFISGGNEVLIAKPHMKYRAYVHTETVSEAMAREDFGQRNSERLIEASANQWFIQYHNNKGSNRILDNGLFTLSPHFKKGVSWSTQISDVIVARYIVGEISSFFPIVLIVFALFFMVMSFRNRTGDIASRSIIYAVALLIVIQMTFVWMAATNRMIFFGQDFPFLSQNARAIMFMFSVLLGVTMLISNNPEEKNDKVEAKAALTVFASRKIPTFFGIYFVVFILVYLFGNRYASLYSEGDGGDSSNASEYNLAKMMNRCTTDIENINKKLMSSQIDAEQLKDNEDVSAKFQIIDDEIHLTEYVDYLAQEGTISQFTLSMYTAFRKHLLSHNSISNIIHLKRTSSGKRYEFALNNGFYSFKSPDYEQKAWKENIYSSGIINPSSIASQTHTNELTIFSIPTSWMPQGNNCGIVDCREINSRNLHHERILHTPDADYLANVPIYPIKTGEILEVHSTQDGSSATYRYGMSQEDVLVKNMIINGKHRYFYPLKEKCFWLKDFSDLAAFCMEGCSDSLILTLDGQLSANVYDYLKSTDKVCSVVALDGNGNVRLMADYKGRDYILDPNDEEEINSKVIEKYLNPNPNQESNLFGNMNLSYLNPGPGSSLKPITYAAVTSQSLYFPWQKLKLLPPKEYPDSSITEDIKYWYVKKYGHNYIYSNSNPFKSIKNDEKGYEFEGQWLVDSKFYLAKSSNYYNALVSYLGKYHSLRNHLQDIFRPAESLDYPKITFDGGHTLYAFKISPEDLTSEENSSLLMHGLYTNFTMPTHLSYTDTLRFAFVANNMIHKKGYSKQRLASIFPWVYPNNSSVMDYELNNEFPSPASQLKQYTLGSYPLHITPLKMAEMYGKLFSLHPDYRASVTPNTKPFVEQWKDQDGAHNDNIWSFYKENLFPGMAECVRTGTARNYLKPLSDTTPYFYYAKTGTLTLKKGQPDDRMLAVVITDKEIKDEIQPSDFHFYVLYFYYKRSGEMPQVEQIVRQVINSKSFVNYMKSI